MSLKKSRRAILQIGGATLVSPSLAFAQGHSMHGNASQMPDGPSTQKTPSPAPDVGVDHRIDIGVGVIELAKNVAVSTKLYNGRFPGPLLRMSEGKPATVEVFNNTDTPEQLHWHGLFLPPDLDGASEEGTPFIPAHGKRRMTLTPAPSGFRFYHSHMAAMSDLSLGLYNGQAGLLYIEPKSEPGAYDKEVFLTLKEFGPYFNNMEMTTRFLEPRDRSRELYDLDQVAVKAAEAAGRGPGYGVGYSFYSINGRSLGFGEPIRVKHGERVLLQIVNASATEIRSLALPNHTFRVVALDGNPVPTPSEVPVLWIGPAERISAIVEMKQPGVWVLGDTDEDARTRGMGVVVEYAGQSGKPQWSDPARFLWDYRMFAKKGVTARPPDETIELLFGTQYSAQDGFDIFTINGEAFSMEKLEPRIQLKRGRRYRLRMRNATDDVHPIHLHRHIFEITSIAGLPTAGVMKDVAMIGAYQEMTIDFVAEQPGPSLFHCHMQQHMDFGFMMLFDCS